MSSTGSSAAGSNSTGPTVVSQPTVRDRSSPPRSRPWPSTSIRSGPASTGFPGEEPSGDRGSCIGDQRCGHRPGRQVGAGLLGVQGDHLLGQVGLHAECRGIGDRGRPGQQTCQRVSSAMIDGAAASSAAVSVYREYDTAGGGVPV